jgi:hypothetical protein
MKNLCILLFAAFALVACSGGGGGGPSGVPGGSHDAVLSEADTNVGYARMADDAGVTLQAQYTFGLALASVSSLRFAVDNILHMKGEGETLEDVVGAAPYDDWDEIVAAGLGSPMPFYFEGLVAQLDGNSAKAADLFNKAKANPVYVERDFSYLNNLSVEQLYALRAQLVEKEFAMLEEYTPDTRLYAERTGAEFSAHYHAVLARDKMKAGDNNSAYGSLVNAVLVSPSVPDYYYPAIAMALETENNDMALLMFREGLWAFPNNAELNYIAATMELANRDVALADGDPAAAQTYIDNAKALLTTAKADPELTPEFSAIIDALVAEIEGN